jgi:nucleoside-diphosphate-sugar epimerase
VVVDDLSSTGSPWLLGDVAADVDLHQVDIRDEDALARLPPGGFDRVYHLAASFANARSIDDPELDRSINVEGTRAIVALAARRGASLLVYTGSSSSYGDAPVPMQEEGPRAPHTPYAHNKLAGESVARSGPVPCAVLRLFNVYGPGDLPGRYRNVIPNMVAQASRGPLRVTGAGATRDFTFVDDVVDVLCRADRLAGMTVNVGTGMATSIEDLARRVAGAVGVEPAIEVTAPRSWDRVAHRVADIARLGAALGTVPTTTLREGLPQTVRWLLTTALVDDAVWGEVA